MDILNYKTRLPKGYKKSQIASFDGDNWFVNGKILPKNIQYCQCCMNDCKGCIRDVHSAYLCTYPYTDMYGYKVVASDDILCSISIGTNIIKGKTIEDCYKKAGLPIRHAFVKYNDDSNIYCLSSYADNGQYVGKGNEEKSALINSVENGIAFSDYKDNHIYRGYIYCDHEKKDEIIDSIFAIISRAWEVIPLTVNSTVFPRVSPSPVFVTLENLNKDIKYPNCNMQDRRKIEFAKRRQSGAGKDSQNWKIGWFDNMYGIEFLKFTGCGGSSLYFG